MKSVDRRRPAVEELAAEVARLEILAAGRLSSEHLILARESARDLLKTEMSRGPLASFLMNADGNAEMALLHAKAHLAADQARDRTQRRAQHPLRRAEWLLIPLLIGVVFPPIVNYITAQQQLNLFRDQNKVQTSRAQADALLNQLSSIVIKSRELQAEMADSTSEDMVLPPAEASRYGLKAVELEQQFRAAVKLHSFDSVPQLRTAELVAYYELRALQDCLDRTAGKPPSEQWRSDAEQAGQKELLKTATSNGPCAVEFDAATFETLTTSVNREVNRLIGGALFPQRESSPK